MAVTAYGGTPHIPQRGRQRAWEVRYGRDHTGQERDRAAHGGFLRREHGAEPHRARAADLRAGRCGPGRGQTGGGFPYLPPLSLSTPVSPDFLPAPTPAPPTGRRIPDAR